MKPRHIGPEWQRDLAADPPWGRIIREAGTYRVRLMTEQPVYAIVDVRVGDALERAAFAEAVR